MYEIFEHTADLGLRILAGDLDTLFAEAGEALFAAICDDPASIRPAEEVEFSVEADRADDLLHDWLAELLYTFHARRMVFARFDVRVELPRLAAVARGEPIDLVRHPLDLEIKAITYHGLKVEREADGWLAEVIVDI